MGQTTYTPHPKGVGTPILCLDFDGVCHSYTSGWINAWTIPDPPVPGLFAFLEKACSEFRVCIYSSRSEFQRGRDAMRGWFYNWAMEHYYHDPSAVELLINQLEFPSTKPAAMVSLDDRAITFTGYWPDIAQLRAFKPWNYVPKTGVKK